MVIRLDENYNAMTSTALLGYVGETNARPVSVEGLTVDGADRYVLTIDYGDGVQYEVDITGGTWTPTADILRSAQTVSCQIAAKKLSGDEYILVKKSRIFRLRIGAAIGDNAVPSPDVSMDALDRIDAIGRQAQSAAETATTMANNAAKSATAAEKSADTAEQAASRAETAKTAAETAAQTAQAVADSLPDDYVTAVGKIAENTAEIANVKLADKELQRRVNALYDMGNGVTHKFETDTDTAYQKAVPTGAKLMSVKSVGGRSITFNQMYKKFDYVSGGTLNCKPIFKSHKYLLRVDYSVSENTKVYLYFRDAKYTAETNRQITKDVAAGSGKISWITSPLGEHSNGGDFGVFRMVTDSDGSQKLDTSTFSNHEIFDLTTMFGSGNEPSTVEEFEKIFPADYYPYNAGEIISAGTEEIVEQGANLYYGTDMLKVGSDDYEYIANSYRCKSIKLKPNTTYTLSFNSDKTSEIILLMNVTTVVNAGQYFDFRKASHTQTYTTGDDGCLYVGVYAGNGNVASADVVKRLSECKIMISEGDTPTAYAPYHSNVYQIPEAIRNLPGYGIEGNVTDYETKTYTQNNIIDGTEVKALDTPIVTDISALIPDDFLRNVEVEAGGSVIFKNSNDSYLIPVPSEEEYIVKLSEVGGTT